MRHEFLWLSLIDNILLMCVCVRARASAAPRCSNKIGSCQKAAFCAPVVVDGNFLRAHLWNQQKHKVIQICIIVYTYKNIK